MQHEHPFHEFYYQHCRGQYEQIICDDWKNGISSSITAKKIHMSKSKVLVIRRAIRKRSMRKFPSVEKRASRVLDVYAIMSALRGVA